MRSRNFLLHRILQKNLLGKAKVGEKYDSINFVSCSAIFKKLGEDLKKQYCYFEVEVGGNNKNHLRIYKISQEITHNLKRETLIKPEKLFSVTDVKENKICFKLE